MSGSLFKKPIVRNLFSAVIITFLSFILLNLTFIFDFLIQSLIRKLLEFSVSEGVLMNSQWFPSMHLFFLVVIALISWKVVASKMNKLIKAAFVTVPLAVVYATIGIFSYPNIIITVILGGVFGVGCFWFLHCRKLHWFYYFSLILISLAMLIGVIFGMEI